ncbi:type II secretion system GspH family protein [Acinetobacter pittii]|uniref:type II secretion system protein n=1 Tax=Acinetobacter calcoaceticus/baumannii complex TaxID=909768 RepID=UPI001EFE0919|nr:MULTISPECIES: type II secretion system protein [Acinetobacter calcoaceticus/baumannii complex]MCG9493177.1 type II secretion system GspH family protein [Acinetobacter pittii]MCU4346312.1 type II secretion system GspH family protein [Acinetobacter lactucae]
MKSQSPLKSQKGFTLIEVMVVIVIMTIMTSLAVLNIGGVDQKKAMQARELFLLDMHKIGKESLDQSRVLALSTLSETDVSPFSYELYEYHDQSKLQVQDLKNRWQKYSEFTTRRLPKHVSFTVQPLDEQNYSKATNTDLIGGQTPQLIWFGNGEAKTVKIQFYFEQKPIGSEIQIDHLGKINEI